MKILTIFTGGTIGCSSFDGVLSPDKANSYLLLDMYLKSHTGVDFIPVQPYTILSENLNGSNLATLYECISSYNLNDFDGIIVTHGTDTLQYTASYLSYCFGLREIPIVMVSANYPLTDDLSNGYINFCSAVDFIKSGNHRGVFVSYKNTAESFTTIHRASRALPHLPYSDDVYSIFNSVYGKVENGTFTKNESYYEEADSNDFVCNPKLSESSDVLYIRPYAGIKYPEITADTKAILLEGYHSGTLNTSSVGLKNFCSKAYEMGVPVFLTGACKGFYYESKKLFSDLKINVLPSASPIAMYMKLWILEKSNIGNVCLSFGGDFN